MAYLGMLVRYFPAQKLQFCLVLLTISFMGRAGRKQQAGRLRVGTDFEGVKRSLGDKDSDGRIVGFIDPSGNCWESALEHDMVRTQALYDEESLLWDKEGGLEPDSLEIARSVCQDPKNIEEAARAAERNHNLFQTVRMENSISKLFIDQAGDQWKSVWEHDVTTTGDAYIESMERWEIEGGPRPDPREYAEKNCIDPDHIDPATESARSEWSVLAQRRSAQGLPVGEASGGYEDGVATYPGQIPGSQIEVIGEEISPERRAKIEGMLERFRKRLEEEGIQIKEEDQEVDEFDSIVEGMEVAGAPEPWQGSFSYHVDALGHTVSVSALRATPKEAYEVGREIESRLMSGELLDQELEAEVTLRAQSPEEQRDAALRRLQEGPERKDLAIMNALGIDTEAILRRDEAIASGRHTEKPLAMVQASGFVPGLGETAVLASGRSEEEALAYLQKVLPGAFLR